MNYKFIGKNTVISEPLKEKAIKKLGRIEKFLPENAEAVVKFSVVKHEHTVEVTIPVSKRVLRAEVVDTDMYVALDKIVDVLEKQLVKYKSRLRDQSRKEPSFKEEFNNILMEEASLPMENLVIQKSKKFALKPMDPEEAIMELELLNHDFYVFRNSISEEVNVVYKRRDGSYGIIEPTL